MNVSGRCIEGPVSARQRTALVVTLHASALKFLRTAKKRLQEGDCALMGVYIGRVQDIVAELNNSLAADADVQLSRISGDLRVIYTFIHCHLNEASIERDPARIDDCIGMLEQLGQAWEQVGSDPRWAVDGDVGAGMGQTAAI